MTRQEQAYNKIQQLSQEIAELQGYVRNIETEYEIITDQYMNGNIDYDIGKEQRAIIKRIKKAEKEYSKLQNDAFKIRQKLSM